MKEELIKKIEEHFRKWNGKHISMRDIVQIQKEEGSLLIELHKFLLDI